MTRTEAEHRAQAEMWERVQEDYARAHDLPVPEPVPRSKPKVWPKGTRWIARRTAQYAIGNRIVRLWRGKPFDPAPGSEGSDEERVLRESGDLVTTLEWWEQNH